MDPVIWFLKLILRGFLKAELKDFEHDFVRSNIEKHRKVLWVNVIAIIFVYLGLQDTSSSEISTVITALIAPVMVLGGAWFGVSFGGVPRRLINIAMSTTLWMFMAFTLSFSAMFVSVSFVTSPYLWPVLIFIYLATLIASIQYDTADGLKAGLDEAMLRHSRAMLLYLKNKEGIEPPEE